MASIKEFEENWGTPKCEDIQTWNRNQKFQFYIDIVKTYGISSAEQDQIVKALNLAKNEGRREEAELLQIIQLGAKIKEKGKKQGGIIWEYLSCIGAAATVQANKKPSEGGKRRKKRTKRRTRGKRKSKSRRKKRRRKKRRKTRKLF